MIVSSFSIPPILYVYWHCICLFLVNFFLSGNPKYCVKPIDESKCNATVAKGLNVTCVTAEDCFAAVIKGDADLTYATVNDMVANGKSEDS